MRDETVRFKSEGVVCVGSFFQAPSASDVLPVPAVLLSHGFAAVRTMRNLPEVTERLLGAGLSVLTIDFRCLGESEGQPRQTVSPFCLRQDLQNALSWLSARPDVDADRLGLWGTSFGGGQVLQVAAFDRRVKAVVAQVPATDLFRQIRTADAGFRAMLNEIIDQDRAARHEGQEPGLLKLAALEDERSLFGADALAWTTRNEQENRTFVNAVTTASIAELVQADPADFIEAVSPTPLLMIMANQDATVSPDLTRTAFARAGNPKKLVTFEGTHYDVYDDPVKSSMAATAARDWFFEHLR